tara:strand:- start:1450 stop:2220 length:771 start_codon:yes stop_codon:yes gene_type:complete
MARTPVPLGATSRVTLLVLAAGLTGCGGREVALAVLLVGVVFVALVLEGLSRQSAPVPGQPLPPDVDLARDLVLPRFQSPEATEARRSQMARTFGPDAPILVTRAIPGLPHPLEYVVQHARGLVPLVEDHLTRLGLSADALHALACANLERRTPEVQSVGTLQCFVDEHDDQHAAAHLLHLQAQMRPGDLARVAVAPSARSLIVFDRDDHDAAREAFSAFEIFEDDPPIPTPVLVSHAGFAALGWAAVLGDDTRFH